MSHSIYFVSAERSGDIFSRKVMDAVLDLDSAAQFRATVSGNVNGMQAEISPIDLSDLAILGWTEAFAAYPRVKRKAQDVAADIVRTDPDLVVLTDSWGFTLRVAQLLRAAKPGLPLVKLIGPQIWASRPGRARTVARLYDLVCSVLPQELDHYRPLGIQSVHMGVPALDGTSVGRADVARKGLGLTEHMDICLVCPGSRQSELDRVAPDLIEAGRQFVSRRSEFALAIAPPPDLSELLQSRLGRREGEYWLPSEVSLPDAMAASSLAFACSGTVTTELVAAGVPTMVGYRVAPLTYHIAKAGMLKSPYISLVNAAARREILPEFIQNALTPQRLIAKAEDWLRQGDGLSKQREAQFSGLSLLQHKKKPASEIAARAILELLD